MNRFLKRRRASIPGTWHTRILHPDLGHNSSKNIDKNILHTRTKFLTAIPSLYVCGSNIYVPLRKNAVFHMSTLESELPVGRCVVRTNDHSFSFKLYGPPHGTLRSKAINKEI